MKATTPPLDLTVFLRALNRYKWWILIAVFVAGLWTGILALKTPRTYVARTTFLLPSVKASAQTQISGLTVTMLDTPFISSPSTVEGLVRSRRMAEHVMNKFFSEEGRDRRSKERTINRIRKMIRVSSGAVGPAGLAIEVRGSDPQLIADIANFCVEVLNVLNEELVISTEKEFAKVLDRAIPPVFPESRKIGTKVAVAMATTGLSLIAILFCREYIRWSYKKS